MKRLILAVALASLAFAPASAVPAPPAPPEATAATAVAEQARAAAERFAEANTAAEHMRRASEIAGHETTLEAPAAISFADALARFYAAAGVAPRVVSPPRADVAAAAAPVIAAVAEAIELTNGALAGVSAEDRVWAVTHLDLFEFPFTAEAQRLAKIASRVNMAAMHRAAALIAAAVDAAPVPSVAVAASWVDPTGAIEIGSTGSDVFGTDRILILDLGGNDQHSNSSGAIGAAPGNTLGIPVSVTADLGGNDSYFVTAPNQSDNTLVAQGVGLGGIGLVIDRWGDDGYFAFLNGSYPVGTCAPDVVFSGYPGRFPQEIYAQGTGGLGVGALIDLSGNDTSYAYSFINTPSSCHFVRSYVHAQGAGLHRGAGILIDDTGDDYRIIDNYSRNMTPGNQDAVAGSYGQGFAAGGAGVLVDKEGNDYNYANSTATWQVNNPSKGTFATTMVQGAVAGLTYQYDAMSQRVAIAATGLAIPLPCLSNGSGGQATRSGPCQHAGVALHADLVGDDSFNALANSQHGNNGNWCFVGSNALVGAHGAAAWGGVAALVNLDAEGRDEFQILPTAFGAPCMTSAIGVGQGFGGAVTYPIWDDPHSWYASTDGYALATPLTYMTVRPALPAIGVLISGGPACPPEARTAAISVADPRVDCARDFDRPTASPDSYTSAPYANNTIGQAIAESRVQGSGGRPRMNLTGNLIIPAPMTIGIGVIADTGGDDIYRSSATALGKHSSSSVSVSQGGTEGGIGALIDLLGNDRYESRTTIAGGTFTEVDQGDARAGFGEPIRPIAILVDAGGSDVYGPAITCQANGGLTTAAIWGDLGTCGAVPGTLIIGIDAISGIQL